MVAIGSKVIDNGLHPILSYWNKETFKHDVAFAVRWDLEWPADLRPCS